MTRDLTASGGTMRLAFNLSCWHPEGSDAGAEFKFLLGLIPAGEAEAVMRFKRFEDKQRALISRLLQRACISRCLGMAWHDVEIKRTKGRKPFVANAGAHKPSRMPNFNFNVSHEGRYVVLASEPVCIVGVDVAAPGQARRTDGVFNLADTMRHFRKQFTDGEMHRIREAGSVVEQEHAFRRNWSCKEAFTKARGDGIGFELARCDFDIRPRAITAAGPATHDADVSVDGARLDSWAFALQPLGDHWVTVARGPPTDVVDAHGEFTRTLLRRNLSQGALADALAAPSDGFRLVGIEDIIPENSAASYATLVDDDDPFA